MTVTERLVAMALMPYVCGLRVLGALWETGQDTRELFGLCA